MKSNHCKILIFKRVFCDNFEHFFPIQTTERVKKELDEKKEAYKKLKKECQKQKQWIAEYQLLIRAGASGSHKVQKKEMKL